MICIRLLSGDELVKVPLQSASGEVKDVKGLQQCLHQLHGMPPRFRQRMLLHGQILDDATKLDSPMELELVLLPYSEALDTERFMSAALRGSAVEVRAMSVQKKVSGKTPE